MCNKICPLMNITERLKRLHHLKYGAYKKKNGEWKLPVQLLLGEVICLVFASSASTRCFSSIQALVHHFHVNNKPELLNRHNKISANVTRCFILNFICNSIQSYPMHWKLLHSVNMAGIWWMIAVKELRGLLDRADPYTWAARDGSATCCSHHYTASA